jgi:hypothetical protein
MQPVVTFSSSSACWMTRQPPPMCSKKASNGTRRSDSQTNYHRLKTVDNVYRQRSAILQRLDAIDRDDSALANA